MHIQFVTLILHDNKCTPFRMMSFGRLEESGNLSMNMRFTWFGTALTSSWVRVVFDLAWRSYLFSTISHSLPKKNQSVTPPGSTKKRVTFFGPLFFQKSKNNTFWGCVKKMDHFEYTRIVANLEMCWSGEGLGHPLNNFNTFKKLCPVLRHRIPVPPPGAVQNPVSQPRGSHKC